MQYINFEKLESITHDQFWATEPYPFANEQGMLTEEGFDALLHNMPDIDLFFHNVGKERRAGQTPHDRYSLEYTPDTNVPKPWQEFIGELCSDRYRNNICRLFGVKKIEFRFHWHYTPTLPAVWREEDRIPFSLALHADRLLGFTPHRLGPGTWLTPVLFQLKRRLGSELGWRHAGAGRRRQARLQLSAWTRRV
jgi:hypothetical protein